MLLFVGACSSGGGDAPPQPWALSINTGQAGGLLNTALLGHYDLSGALYDYPAKTGLVSKMSAVGFSDWRISAGRWEQTTQLLPKLSDGTDCPPESGIFADSLLYSSDLDLIAERDWFIDAGNGLDTNDDASYALGYVRSVIDAATAFGAEPFVSIDYMPLALSFNQIPNRTDCTTTYMNAVTNNRPQDNAVFASAVAGLVQRVVEGSGLEGPRAVTYWEIWNEPEFRYFWEPDFAADPTPFFNMAVLALVQLDAYRTSSGNSYLKFGLASFANSDYAIATITGFDTPPPPPPAPPSIYPVPMDFISFHGYNDDPLVIVEKIEQVAAAAQSSTNYQNIELALAEWGPDLATSAGDQIYAASMGPPLHAATVIALGAAAGLDRAHRAIFYDFHPNIALGLLNNAASPKPLYRGYEMLAKVIFSGAMRLTPDGMTDGKFEGGMGAVLVSKDSGGTIRVLFVNRNTGARSASVELDSTPETPTTVYVFDGTDDPAQPLRTVAATGPDIELPAESLVVVEY